MNALESLVYFLEEFTVNLKKREPNNLIAQAQPKSTLKWKKDGELSHIDMAYILEKLSRSELTQCDVTCEVTGPD